MNDCLRNSTLLSWVVGNDVLLLARVYEKVLDAGEVTDLPFDLSACDDISVTATNSYKKEVLEWAVAQELTELLVTDKYPTGVLLALLSDGSATEREAFRQFRFLCKQVAAEVLGLPETEAMRQERRAMEIDAIDTRTDAKILNGYQWTVLHGADAGKTVSVWLSAENQNNYKAKHDAARMYPQLVTFPMTYKISEDEGRNAIYETFQNIDELAEFYLGGIAYIEQTVANGWRKKDAVDLSLYET